MPANMQSFVLLPSWVNANRAYTPAAPKLYRIEPSGQRTELAIVEHEELHTVSPAQPVAPGALLELEWLHACATLAEAPGNPPIRALRRVRVTAAEPLPTTLGALKADRHDGPISVPRAGSCSEMIEATYWNLSIRLSEEARPYGDLLRYELEVDGEPAESYRDAQGWRLTVQFGGSSLGRGLDRVYGLCNVGDAYAGNISIDVHRVRMIGTLPDGTRLKSDEVELGYRPGCRSGADAGSPRASGDFGPDAGASTKAKDGEGDGCSLGGGRRFGTTGAWLVLAGTLARRGRPRRL